MADPKLPDTTAPDVFEYLDYRAYLRDWTTWRAEQTEPFSQRALARRAGVKSPSLFQQILKGKRSLTVVTAQGFGRAMGLDDEERSFLQLLVEHDKAPTLESRTDAWKRLSATRRFRKARDADLAGYDFLSNWTISTIRELATTDGFRADPDWIAKQLRPRITPRQASSAMDVLERLGMLKRHPDGSVTVTEGSIRTPHEVARDAVMTYHQSMTDLAKASVERFAADQRHLAAVTAAVPASLVPKLKKEVQAFQERILDMTDQAQGPRTRVMQFNAHLFPLTTDVETT